MSFGTLKTRIIFLDQIKKYQNTEKDKEYSNFEKEYLIHRRNESENNLIDKVKRQPKQ